MKYMISESRINNMVDVYLQSQLEPSKIVQFKILGVDEPKIYWIVNDNVVGEFEEDWDKFWISKEIFNGVKGHFQLFLDETKNQIRRYLREFHDINVTIVHPYVFSSDIEQRWYEKYGKK